MKRKIFAVALVLCLLSALMLPVCAAAPHVVDQADLLSDGDTASLEILLSKISRQHNVDVVIVTVDSTDGKTPMDYADDYFDYNGYGADGILLLVSMEDRDWWVSTTGFGITAITDAGLDYISDRFVPYLSDGDYAEGFRTFANLCDDFLTQAETGDPYDIYNLPKAPFAFVRNLAIALVVGLIVALIATGVMKAKLKSVRQQAKADDYMIKGSMRLTQSRDIYLYTHLERREKPKEGSSTHRSSSGTSHGGGGGKF